MPMRRISYQRHLVLPQTQQIKMNETQEPIYENVPLPWQNESTTRDRAQSLTTTDEISRLNDRNSSHPTINNYGNLKPTLNLPNYHLPVKIELDNYYMNAQVIKGVRETSVPKDLNISSRSINKTEELENISLAVDKLSLKNDDKDFDETPYQSLSTHKISNNNIISKSSDNVTSIIVPDIKCGQSIQNLSQNTTDSALSSSITNSAYTSVELENSKNSVSNKEKKRRRWGVFMGRGNKTVEVKSATLGRDRAKANAGQTANKHRWSTGLPKFQPLPPSITKETLCTLLERKMSDDQLAFAFEQIPKGRESGGEIRTALLPQYAALNDFCTDHLPYEDNRVRLHPTPANPHGYINASHITMTVGSTQRFYVAVKCGAGSAAQLWECVWQLGARLMALVADTPPPYLPPEHSAKDYGQFNVSTSRWSQAAWGGSVRLRVRRAGGAGMGTGGGAARVRTLWHVQFARWSPAQHVPDDVSQFLEFLSELNGLRLACETGEEAGDGVVGGGSAPLAVICPQGAGRSGVALAAHLLLHVLDTNQELDIPRTISMLHQQRANLIQNVHQYKFLHQVLLHYLKQSRLI
ncbi:unnamed protein product [Parnassius apollo]|uniref:(apollo) hypothetical protein n=1 Tax=Parnassius apollo TaxID=110799 RepID=A0A8S3X522_PARAO|nr:unnamed protein product [Parnassius apollo]